MTVALKAVIYLAFVPLAWQLGNRIVRFLLDRSLVQARPVPSQAGNTQANSLGDGYAINAGRYIGFLERVLIILGLVSGKWDIIALVVALKTVARYKELDKQISAEYFLVGSLASIVWAILLALVLSWFDSSLGFHVFQAAVEPEQKPLLEYITF
jgi:hypothetical protein